MIIQTNLLRDLRKNNKLSQEDIAYLLDLSSKSNVSRFESDSRSLSIKQILGYHILFDIPLDDFYPSAKQEINQRILNNAIILLAKLQVLPRHSIHPSRLKYLESTVSRLNASTKYE